MESRCTKLRDFISLPSFLGIESKRILVLDNKFFVQIFFSLDSFIESLHGRRVAIKWGFLAIFYLTDLIFYEILQLHV